MAKKYKREITGDEARMVVIKYPWSEEKWQGFVSQEDKKPKATYKAGSKKLLIKKAENAFFERDTERYVDFDNPEAVVVYKMTNGQSNNLADIKARDIDRECGPFNDEVRKFCTNDAKSITMLHLLLGPIIQEKKKGTILHIPTSKAADTIAFLRSIAQSFIGDHYRCGQEIELIQPAYLPTNVRESHLIASAYITDYESETVRLPAVYENTSVVLNNNIIKPMEVVKFVQRNPYCQVLLYGSVPRALQELVVQEFDLDDMGSVSVNWNCNVLRAMTSAFVKSVSDGEVALQAFSWARQMIDLYLIKHQIQYGRRFEMAELYLATAKLLVDFLRTADQLDERACAELCNLLYNAVLPGCYTPPTESGVPTQAIPLAEENFEDAVQQTISCMLEDHTRFIRMETGKKWPNTDIENGCYGYFHLFDQDHTKKNLQETVLFTVDDFTKLFAQFCPYDCSDAKLLKKKIKQLSEGEAGGCCLKRGDNRDYFGKDNPRKRSVRLIINQLDFLPKEQQAALKAACYPDQTDNSK